MILRRRPGTVFVRRCDDRDRVCFLGGLVVISNPSKPVEITTLDKILERSTKGYKP